MILEENSTAKIKWISVSNGDWNGIKKKYRELGAQGWETLCSLDGEMPNYSACLYLPTKANQLLRS
jgi:hypothetical protein